MHQNIAGGIDVTGESFMYSMYSNYLDMTRVPTNPDDLITWTKAMLEGGMVRMQQLKDSGIVDRLPEGAVKELQHYEDMADASYQARKMIEDIGTRVGEAADALVDGTINTVFRAPIMPSRDFVWRVARAFWHEVVYRGMEIGQNEELWIKGLREFSWHEVLCFVQHIWLAFKEVTGLDITDPKQSAIIKSWLGSLSPRTTGREKAPDMHSLTDEKRVERLQHYIDHGGLSRRAMTKRGLA